MVFSTEFDELFQTGVTVSDVISVSTDGYGTEVFDTGSTFKARHVRKQTLVRTFAGTEELAQSTVWIASTSTFAPAVRIVLSGSTGALGPLMALEAFPDEDGVHHTKAFFG